MSTLYTFLMINQYCNAMNIMLALHFQIIKNEVQNDKEIFFHLEYGGYFNITIQSKSANS